MGDDADWDRLLQEREENYVKRLDRDIAQTQERLLEAEAARENSLSKLKAHHETHLSSLACKAEYEMRRSQLVQQQQQRKERAEAIALTQMQRHTQLIRSDNDGRSIADAELQHEPFPAAGAPATVDTAAGSRANAQPVNTSEASSAASSGSSSHQPQAQAAARAATNASAANASCDRQSVAEAAEVSNSAYSDDDFSDSGGDIDADVLMDLADSMSEHDESSSTAIGSVQQVQQNDAIQQDISGASTPVQQPVWSIPSTPTATAESTAASTNSSTQANDQHEGVAIVSTTRGSTSHKAQRLNRGADTSAATTTAVTDALVVLLRAVLLSAAVSKVQLDERVLEVAYTELDSAGHSAPAVLRQQFSAHKSVKLFTQIETMLKRYGKPQQGQPTSWYTLGNSGIVYAADSAAVIDTATLLTSADAVDVLIGKYYSNGPTASKAELLQHVIQQRIQQQQSSNTGTDYSTDSSGCVVAVDDVFLTVVHDIQLRCGLLYHQLDLLKGVHRDFSRLACKKVGRFRKQLDTIDKKSLVYTVHNKEVFIYDMAALCTSERIQDRLKYCYLTGNYEQPHSMHDVHAMISTEWPNECDDELMQQAHTVAAANFAAVTDTKDKLTALKEVYSIGDNISKAQCTALRQKFTSLEQAELDETASFSIHKDYLVCEILPLLIKTSSSTYKANEHYVQLLERRATASKSKKQSRGDARNSTKSSDSSMPAAMSNSTLSAGTNSGTASTAAAAAAMSTDEACDTAAAAASAVDSDADDTHVSSTSTTAHTGAATTNSGSGKRKAIKVHRDRTSVLSGVRSKKVIRTLSSQQCSFTSVAAAAVAAAALRCAAGDNTSDTATAAADGTVYDFEYQE
jgi:hypothetical protein